MQTGTVSQARRHPAARENGHTRLHAGSVTPPTWQWLQLLSLCGWAVYLSVSLQSHSAVALFVWMCLSALSSLKCYPEPRLCRFILSLQTPMGEWVSQGLTQVFSLSLSCLISLRRHSPIVVEACSTPLIGRRFWRVEPASTALLLLSLARSFCLRQLEWMVRRKQESRTLRGGTVCCMRRFHFHYAFPSYL